MARGLILSCRPSSGGQEGRWTADGRYSRLQRRRECAGQGHLGPARGTGWISRGARLTVELTQGPLSYWQPVPSPDGRRIFAIGRRSAASWLATTLAQPVPPVPLGDLRAHHRLLCRWPVGQLHGPSRGHPLARWRDRVMGSDLAACTLRVALVPDGEPVVLGGCRWKRLTYLISADGGLPNRSPILAPP